MATRNFIDKDRGWKRIKKDIKSFDNDKVKVGLLSDSGKAEDGDVDLAAVAAFNEFGTKDIPARPFMAQTFDKNRDKLKRITESLYGRVIDGNISSFIAIRQLGEWYTGKMQKMVTRGSYVANARSTVNQKGSSRPLIAKGHMRDSIKFKVIKRS